MPIKFVSINIEREKHIDKIIHMLQEVKPDLVCLQEVMQYNLQEFAATHNYFVFFSPTTQHKLVDDEWEGTAILSRHPFSNCYTHQYAGPETPELYDKSTTETLHKSRRYLLQVCDIEIDKKCYTLANTHFTWSADGQADDYQRQDLQKMMQFLKQHQPLVFSGDFNAPRGREIFSAIASQYRDNIPTHYETSLDQNLHRCGYLPYVVDGLFSTPEYQVTDVELVFGVSDHAAVKAKIDIN